MFKSFIIICLAICKCLSSWTAVCVCFASPHPNYYSQVCDSDLNPNDTISQPLELSTVCDRQIVGDGIVWEQTDSHCFTRRMLPEAPSCWRLLHFKSSVGKRNHKMIMFVLLNWKKIVERATKIIARCRRRWK